MLNSPNGNTFWGQDLACVNPPTVVANDVSGHQYAVLTWAGISVSVAFFNVCMTVGWLIKL